MKLFTRHVEDFVCGHCGSAVHGNGYTNHCPHCLWCKHVDINPGDRSSTCQGMMRPIGSVFSNSEFSVIQKCTKCGFQRRNKMQQGDDFDVLVHVSKSEL